MTSMILPINEILERLMFEKRIRTAELARKTHLPQPTVQRIVSGFSPNPHLASLKPIADFFDITVEQLKGLEPIDWLQSLSKEDIGLNKIPHLNWEQALKWSVTTDDYLDNEKVYIDVKVSSKSFALTIKDSSMEPQFPKGTLIIIDTNKEPKDRCFVIASIEGFHEVVFRQLLINGPNKFLKPTSPDFDQYRITPLNESDKIIGVLVQARRNYEE